MTLSVADLVGAWELVEFRIEFDDDRPALRPFGDASGQLVYTDSGRMSAALSAEGRQPLAIDELERASRAPDDERLAAFDSYTSYCGRYRVDGDCVVHIVDLALMPNIVGREQVREVTLDGDDLTLAYDRPTADQTYRYVLRWRRA